jgi:hypothetical protein
MDDYKYTNRSGVRDLEFGDKVRLSDDYADTDLAGLTFQWMGTAALGQGRDLGAEDYTDFELWKQLSATTLITDSLSYALLSEAGVLLKKENLTGTANSYYGLIDHNDVRTLVEAHIGDTTVTAGLGVSVVAIDAARIVASENSEVTPWEGIGGVIATNAVLSSADARIVRTPVTTDGDLSVDAEHVASIDASTTSRMEAWDAKTLVVAFNSIGWIPVNLFFAAADVLTSTTDYLYDFTSNDRPDSLDPGDTVWVVSGPHAGESFAYAGPAIATGPVELAPEFQNYDNATLWHSTTLTLGVVFDYTTTSTPATLGPGKRVKLPNGSIYKYVGDTPLTSPDLTPVTGQDYNDIDRWLNVTPTFGGQKPSYAQAFLIDSTVTAGGDVSVTANSGTQLNALAGNDNVVEAALDLIFTGAQTTTKTKNPKTGKVEKKTSGYGASGAAGGIVLAANKVSAFAKAQVIFTGAQGDVTAGGDVDVSAQNTAAIESHSSVIQDVATSNDLTGLIPIINSVLLPSDYDYTTASGAVTLETGDQVRLGASYAHGGVGGAVYRYQGTPGALLDLGTVDFGGSDWHHLVGGVDDPESLYPGIGNFTNSDARSVGILIVLNDMRSDASAAIANADVTAGGDVSITALQDAMLLADAQTNVSASGGSFYGSGTVLAVNGQLVTNAVLSSAQAWLEDAAVDAGSVAVEALSTTGIDATILSATASGDTGVGITLAFNSIGWKPQNFLFNAADAIVGDPLISSAFAGERPAATTASVARSTIVASGDLTVSALGASRLNATVSNAASSRAAAMFNATGKAVGAIVASNKVSTLTSATVEETTATVDGAVSVNAEDEAGVYSNIKIVSSSITTNDGGTPVLQNELDNFVTADFISTETAPSLAFGDRVRIAADQATDDVK